ncbi:MAG: hypothetical protein KF726_07360 [Anaerolineae bacterium]|nr:hypothetical protein [Anaerolineae bacterium]
MSLITVTVDLQLPEELAEQAKSAGILDSAQMADLIAKELERRKRAQQFFTTIQKLHDLEPPLTQEEIDEEIRLAREDARNEPPHS